LNDTLFVSTLAQISKIILFNPITKNSWLLNFPNGNPQGIIKINDSVFAATLADWGDGTGKEVVLYDIKNSKIIKSLQTHLNPVDIEKFGNLYAVWTWGSWFGNDNFGTLEIFNNNFQIKNKIVIPKKGKISQILPVNDSILYITAFDENYDFFNLFYYPNSNKIDTLLNQFWTNNTIYKKNKNYYLIKSSTNSSVVYDEQLNNTNIILPFFSTLVEVYNYPKVVTKNEIIVNKDYKLKIINYPNPFNPTTNIKFTIPNNGFVNLSIYNIQGEKVATLFDSHLTKGEHTTTFTGNNLSSGIYIYQLKYNNAITTGKMLLLK